MKSSIEIHLRTVHLGDARQVVTLGIDGKDHAKSQPDTVLRLIDP